MLYLLTPFNVTALSFLIMDLRAAEDLKFMSLLSEVKGNNYLYYFLILSSGNTASSFELYIVAD
jgi:hypothetical protein